MLPSPDPPRAGEIWRLARDARQVALVLDCRDAIVSFAWLEGPAQGDEAAPLEQWLSAFEVVFEKQDHADATPARRQCLIDDFSHRFRGHSVLELGSHTGGLTGAIVRHARSTTLVENNPRCIPVLAARFAGAVEILHDDFHHALWRLPPGRFDIVVCAGVLYHSAHPLWLLEAMARLQPHSILIDTIHHDVVDARVVSTVMTNSLNYRYNRLPDCGLAVVLGDAVIAQAMARLGYGRMERIRKDGAAIAPEADSDYFQAWKRGLAAWFEGEG